MKHLIIILVLLSLLIAGCGADYGRVKIDEESVEVEAGKDGEHRHDCDHRGKDGKCPPGHRMKGWCK